METTLNQLMVAVGGDARDHKLVELAGGISRLTGQRVTLAHAAPVRHFRRSYVRRLKKVDQDALALTRRREESAEQAARVHLSELKKLVPEGRVSTVVLRGDPVSAFLKHCRETDPSLILCGSPRHPDRGLETLFSPALALVAMARQPVLVLSSSAEVERLVHGPRIMVADDLTPQSRIALRFGANFALAMGSRSVEQIHVSDLDVFKGDSYFFDIYVEAMGRKEPTPDAEELIAYHRAKLEEEMREQVAACHFPASVGAAVAIRPLLRTGSVTAALTSQARDEHADLIVFGRHAAGQRNWPPFGRHSFESLMDGSTSVVIVPACQRQHGASRIRSAQRPSWRGEQAQL